MRVMIVDDSVVFRSQIKVALSDTPEIEIVGTAANGRIAIQKLEQSNIDLITLDMEMPEMDGFETLQAMKEKNIQTKAVVFSAQTAKGSEAALRALALGACDFVRKPAGEDVNIQNAASKIKEELVPKVLQFLPKQPKLIQSETKAVPVSTDRGFLKKEISVFRPEMTVIGSSTGGPPTLEKIFREIKPPIKSPILIAQHMPPVFTATLAKRLGDIHGIVSAEAEDMQVVEPGRIYVAPGDYHMRVKKVSGQVRIRLDQGPMINSVRPAVDPLFESASEVFGTSLLGIVLTGMGYDGAVGCVAIKKRGGGVLIQNEESSTVWGMPKAVFDEGAFDEQGDEELISRRLKYSLNM